MFHEIQLDRPRHLRFNFNAISLIEERMRTPIASLFDQEKPTLSLGLIRLLLWAGLKHEDPLLTIERAGDLVDAWIERHGDFGGLAAKVMKAFTASGVLGRPAKPGEKPEEVPADPPAPAQEN